MSTLYNQVDSNIRKTWLLITFFLIFIIGLGYLFSYLLDNSWILVIAVILSVLMSFGSYWYSDKAVLLMAGAKPVKKKDYLELYRIVENLSITAGLPLPKIYVINEDQPNAFATGRDANHAVIAVTRGLLKKLNRVELEGVIAHEFSHIKNRDILLNTVVVVLAGAIALASDFFLRITFWGGDSDDSDRGGILLLVIGVVAAILAPLAASIIQLAISRKREFLADETGALLTRYPEGLASALEKISQDQTPMKSVNSAIAHLYIQNPIKGKKSKSWFARLFMTHPPIEERIKALREMEV